jgi:lipopolysaccharide heptosyltransferase I
VRILLVRLSALGDVVTGLHVLATVRARIPLARIGWLVEDRFATLLEGHPQIDTLHVYERRRFSFPRSWARVVRLARGLRRERYDLALDLQGNLKSGLLARMAGARRLAGLDRPLSREGNRFLVRERVRPPQGHRLEAYRALLDAVLGKGPVAPAILPAAATGEGNGAVVLHPGVSRFGSFKRWPAGSFAELGDRLAARLVARVVLTAGPGEREGAEEVRKAMRAGASIVEPPGLRELAGVLAGARLVVACDTGPAHVAAATGAPTLTLFGPKDPAIFAPAGPRARTVRSGVRCSPCGLRACPDPVCMTALDVDRVERAALALLGSPA